MDIESNYFCSKCQMIVEGGMVAFRVHMRTPDHVPPYLCGHADCAYQYMHLSNFYNHVQNRHSNLRLQDENVPIELEAFTDSASVHEDDDDEEEEVVNNPVIDEAPTVNITVAPQPVKKTVNLARTAERVVLNIRSGAYMTMSALQTVQKQSYTLMQDTSDYLKMHVEEFLNKPEKTKLDEENLLKAFSLSDPFKHIKTKAQQMKVFTEKYGLIEPQEVFLGYGFDSRQHPKRPRLETRQVMKSFQYVSIKEILKCVLSDPVLCDLIAKEKKSTDGYIRSFKDGSLYEDLPPELKDAIRIVLYIDDLEITQALSPAAGDYKIAGMYFGIQNLPAELNAMLTYIFVTALAFADDAKNEKVWEPFLKDMRELETHGIDILIDGHLVNFKAVLIAQIGDSLAASEILGFRKSSANKFCRWCYIDRREMWEDGCKLGEPRTAEKHVDDVLAAAESEANKTASGVDGPSMLKGLSVFKPIGFSVFDVFHDLLQGINKMEIKLALRHYVCVKKYFTIEELRSRVQFFDYGYPDKKNKPRSSFTSEYLKKLDSYNLHQSGAQVWCLTRAFPFLFADLVPDEDPFMKLISLLNQIMTIVFSHAISPDDIARLEQLIKSHHELFQEIFPGTAEPTVETEATQSNEVNEQQQEEEIEDPGFQDFFDDSDVEVVEPQGNTSGGEVAGPSTQNKRKRPKIIRMINKHHHSVHYPELIKKFGPLVLYWCMRYEARHLFFKVTATISHNYKNVLKTLMEVFQMKVAADKQQETNRLIMGIRGTKKDTVENFPHQQLLLDMGLQASSTIYSVQHVTFNGVDYRPYLFAVVAIQSVGYHPKFSRIEAIYISENQENVYLVTRDWRTVRFEAKYCAYEVEPQDTFSIIRSPSSFPSYRLLATWKRYDSTKLYLAPRTIA